MIKQISTFLYLLLAILLQSCIFSHNPIDSDSALVGLKISASRISELFLSEKIVTDEYDEVISPQLNALIADTIRYQLGDKLYFRSNNTLNPKDSITVITRSHYIFIGNDKQSSYYRFIVHNKYSNFHKPFSTKSLHKEYNSYFTKSEEYLDENFADNYKKSIKEQQDTAKAKSINPYISQYEGYWVYLTKEDSTYYLDDIWAWRGSFCIYNGILTHNSMDGLYPEVIEKFELINDGGFRIKLVHESEPTDYKLVDKRLKIYCDKYGYYITPANNIHSFDIIEYANNTGDLM